MIPPQTAATAASSPSFRFRVERSADRDVAPAAPGFSRAAAAGPEQAEIWRAPVLAYRQGRNLHSRATHTLTPLRFLWDTATRPAPEEARWKAVAGELGGISIALGLTLMSLGHTRQVTGSPQATRTNHLGHEGALLVSAGLLLGLAVAALRFQSAEEAELQAGCVDEAFRTGRRPADATHQLRVQNELTNTEARIQDLTDFTAQPVEAHIATAKARYEWAGATATRTAHVLGAISAALLAYRHMANDPGDRWLTANAAIAGLGMSVHILGTLLTFSGPCRVDGKAGALRRRAETAPEELSRLQHHADQLRELR